jgi:Leucine-rich repeat (LRR) protein
MKRTLISTLVLSLISTGIFATPVIKSSNECVLHMDQHVFGSNAYFYQCNLSDADVEFVMAYLQNHPEVTMFGSSNISSKSATFIAQNHALKYLFLSHSPISGEGMAALAAMPSLEELNIPYSNITDKDAALLAKSSQFRLNIDYSHITNTGVQRLANSKIGDLSLSGVTLNQASLKALGEDKFLYELNVSDAGIDDQGVRLLMHSKSIVNLFLDDNHIGRRGAEELSDNNTLTSLSLGGNAIGDRGVFSLAQNTTLQNLFIDNTQIDAEAAFVLAGNSNLVTLDMSDNVIGDQGAIALAHNKSLTDLYLVNTQLGNLGLEAVSQMPLNVLDVSYNQLDDTSITKLSDNYQGRVLLLSYNHIHDQGAIALSKNKVIRWLNVSYNAIGADGIAALKNNAMLGFFWEGNDPTVNVLAKKQLHHKMKKLEFLKAHCASRHDMICAKLNDANFNRFYVGENI